MVRIYAITLIFILVSCTKSKKEVVGIWNCTTPINNIFEIWLTEDSKSIILRCENGFVDDVLFYNIQRDSIFFNYDNDFKDFVFDKTLIKKSTKNTLIFSSHGYKTKCKRIDIQIPMNLKIEEKINYLDERYKNKLIGCP